MTPPKPHGKIIITAAKLNRLKACSGGLDWFKSQKEKELKPILHALLADHFNWANWLIVRCMTKKQQVQYAIFAAEQVLSIIEKKCPDDKRPRLAIEAAKNWVKDPTAQNKNAAYAAGAAANAAAYAAAYAAAVAADAAAYAAYAAAAYAAYTAGAAGYAAGAAAKKKLQKAIVDYGLKLLGQL